MAKKTSLTQEARKAILEALRDKLPLSFACDIAKVPRQTCYDLMNSDYTWRTQIAHAKTVAIRDLIESTNRQGGAWKLLKNIGKEEFKEHVEHAVSVTQGDMIEDADGKLEEY